MELTRAPNKLTFSTVVRSTTRGSCMAQRCTRARPAVRRCFRPSSIRHLGSGRYQEIKRGRRSQSGMNPKENNRGPGVQRKQYGKLKLADGKEEHGKGGQGEISRGGGLRGWLGRSEEDGGRFLHDSVGSEMKCEPPWLRAHVENDENRLAAVRILAKKREDKGVLPIKKNAVFALQGGLATAQR